MTKYKSYVIGFSTQEISTLTTDEIEAFFVEGQKWDLTSTLKQGGVIIFPHTLIRTSGAYIASVVLACLRSGARRVIGIGVLHSLDKANLIEARAKARRGEDVSKDACRGIFGTNFPGDQTWRTEYSLESFSFLWDYAIKKLQIENPPELILAYPSIANKEPETLPGVDQLKSYLPDSVVVATADFCHHGVAYPLTMKPIIPISEAARTFAIDIIEQGFKIIEKPDFSALIDYCFKTVCDGTDVFQVLAYLLGPLKSRIVDIKLVDVSHLYENDPSPSWVAATLISMLPLS